jgi:hypothetical protein
MQHPIDQREDDPWFVYIRRPGKISAAPANVKGWIALIACITITTCVGVAISAATATLHPVVIVLGLTGTILVGVLLTIKLAVAKGRQID